MVVRHPVAEATAENIFGKLSPEEFHARHGVKHSTEYINNSRGFKLFTQWWIPLPPTEIIGCVAVVHGYTGETSWQVQLTSILFAESGFAVCAIDHQGHGLSDCLDGLTHHIPDLSPVVDDCIQFFDRFRDAHARNLPAFLYSESLGGAIALYITLRQKGAWDGLILNGAMCGISKKFKPVWPLELILPVAAKILPTWRAVPTRGTIVDVSFKEEWKRKLVMACPGRILARPRVATAYELVRVCKDLQRRWEEVEVPFLISHGEKDVICDPASAQELYERAASADKTIKIYPGLLHQMIGESEEDTNMVFGDMVEWLQTRAKHDEKMADTVGATAENGGA